MGQEYLASVFATEADRREAARLWNKAEKIQGYCRALEHEGQRVVELIHKKREYCRTCYIQWYDNGT
jgi:hypothetical protein